MKIIVSLYFTVYLYSFYWYCYMDLHNYFKCTPVFELCYHLRSLYKTWCASTSALQARAKYLSVAKNMKAYEDRLFEQWVEQVQAVLPSLLKRNLLVKPHDRQPPSSGPIIDVDDGQDPEAGKMCDKKLTPQDWCELQLSTDQL